MSAKRGPKSNKPKTLESKYELRDIVLGKLKGYPPWPGMIVDPDSVPEDVQKDRSGKKTSHLYCVRFFPVGDYSWLDPKSISRLQKHEIDSYFATGAKRANGDLSQAYEIARDPRKWEEQKADETSRMEEDEAADEEDQLDDEDGDSKKNKKRKRPASDDNARTKKAKKSSIRGKKSKDTVESEDGEGDADGDAEPITKKKAAKVDENEDPLAKDPEAVKVREWRHKLQKVFLSSNKAPPKEEDMPGMDELFTTIETYPKMDVQYLQFSKIGKVMRHIAALSPDKIPKDPEYKFRDRAKVLVDKWHQVMQPVNGTNSSQAPAVTTEDAMVPATNGAEISPAPAVIPDTNGEAKPDVLPANSQEEEDVPMNGPADQSVLTNVGDVTMNEDA